MPGDIGEGWNIRFHLVETADGLGMRSLIAGGPECSSPGLGCMALVKELGSLRVEKGLIFQWGSATVPKTVGN